MKTALLIADLEGVAGVEQVDALLCGSPLYPAACARLTAEVAAACRGFLAAGFERIRVSDSHRSGAPALNLDLAGLPAGVELRFEEDAFAESLFEGVSAVACLGMHAAAGTRGFAAHTVTVHCAFLAGRRSLSEAELFLGLCAEKGVPVAFVSGDDVLGAALKGRVRYLQSKRSLSRSEAASREHERVCQQLFRAAQQAPREAPRLPRPALALGFKSRWQAELAIRAGARPAGECLVWLEGQTARERYDQGLAHIEASGPTLARALRGAPGSPDFREDAAAALGRPTSRRAPPDPFTRAKRALKAFLFRTSGSAEWQRADRALTLHMLETHASRFFRRSRLGPRLKKALCALPGIPARFGFEVGVEDALGRLDALYLLRERGLPSSAPDPAELSAYVEAVGKVHGPLWGWVFAELARAIGIETSFTSPPRPCRDSSRIEDLYWLTHLVLFETRYLRRPLAFGRLDAEVEELILAAPWLCGGDHLDLAAEVAFCLQAAGEQGAAEHRALIGLLCRRQRSDGSVIEPPGRWDSEQVTARQQAHSTAAALVALAGAAG